MMWPVGYVQPKLCILALSADHSTPRSRYCSTPCRFADSAVSDGHTVYTGYAGHFCLAYHPVSGLYAAALWLKIES